MRLTQEQIDAQEAAFKKATDEATDWRATCKKCGAVLKGSLAQLRAHKCDG